MAYKYQQGVKITLTRSKIIVLLMVAAAVFSGVLYSFYAPRPITSINYHGNVISFRVDLREASKTPVYPDEASITNLIWNKNMKSMAIAFMNTSDMGIVAVEAAEIANKLTTAYLNNGIVFIRENLTEIPANSIKLADFALNSFDELNAEAFDTIIFLISPSVANETSVKVEGNVIYIQGKTNKDFDLATVKFLMAALEIKL